MIKTDLHPHYERAVAAIDAGDLDTLGFLRTYAEPDEATPIYAIFQRGSAEIHRSVYKPEAAPASEAATSSPIPLTTCSPNMKPPALPSSRR